MKDVELTDDFVPLEICYAKKKETWNSNKFQLVK